MNGFIFSKFYIISTLWSICISIESHPQKDFHFYHNFYLFTFISHQFIHSFFIYSFISLLSHPIVSRSMHSFIYPFIFHSLFIHLLFHLLSVYVPNIRLSISYALLHKCILYFIFQNVTKPACEYNIDSCCRDKTGSIISVPHLCHSLSVYWLTCVLLEISREIYAFQNG